MVTPPATASWLNDARLCEANDASVCEDPGQVCAPTPPSPYLSQLCVMRVIGAGQTPPQCPAGYLTANEALYARFSDTRGCSECGCSGVTGGSCSGKFVMSSGSDCNGSVDYTPGSLCKPFDLGPGAGVQPTHVGNQFTVVPGNCSVASPPQGTGRAEPSGQVTVVCCQ